MPQPRVAVVFGSDSDWDVMKICVEQLRAFDLDVHVEVMSAHRSPQRVHEFARVAREEGFEVIVAGAGMSAALAGTVAASTTLPVIGVPIEGGALGGLDALLSTVQMPPGVPVGCVGIGQAGARNAALLAVSIVALHDAQLAEKYQKFRTEQANAVTERNRKLQDKLR
jgi:phosphoribosylaminoimidazole carboxylase PurE protein